MSCSVTALPSNSHRTPSQCSRAREQYAAISLPNAVLCLHLKKTASPLSFTTLIVTSTAEGGLRPTAVDDAAAAAGDAAATGEAAARGSSGVVATTL